MTAGTPQMRSQIASVAANARWANEDPAVNAARGQAGLRAKFEREVRDKTPGLTDKEYARRAECAYRAHMGRLTLARMKASAARKPSGDAA